MLFYFLRAIKNLYELVLEHQGIPIDITKDETMDFQLKAILDLIIDLTKITDEHQYETQAIHTENMRKKRILTSLTRSTTNDQIYLSLKEKESRKIKAVNYAKKTVTIQSKKLKRKSIQNFLSKSLN